MSESLLLLTIEAVVVLVLVEDVEERQLLVSKNRCRSCTACLEGPDWDGSFVIFAERSFCFVVVGVNDRHVVNTMLIALLLLLLLLLCILRLFVRLKQPETTFKHILCTVQYKVR